MTRRYDFFTSELRMRPLPVKAPSDKSARPKLAAARDYRCGHGCCGRLSESCLRGTKSVMFIKDAFFFVALLSILFGSSAFAQKPGSMIVVRGAAGTAEYGQAFDAAAERWRELSENSGMALIQIGMPKDEPAATDRDLLKTALESAHGSDGPLWIVLIGHGTSYRGISKFNLEGPDVSSKELKKWLTAIDHPTILINCSSSSGAFVKDLANPNCIVMTATKSGAELNYSRFAVFMSLAISDLASDLDHDEQVSLLEAFLTASKGVQKFYDDESRLATEQALLDDNGDGFGTPATFFKGIRSAKAAKDGKQTDGRRAHQLILSKNQNQSPLTPEQIEQRDRLEVQIEELRARKAKMDERSYFADLEKLMVELARIYHPVESATPDVP